MIAAPGTGGMAFLDQHRRRAGGIEHQELLAPLPDPLLDQRATSRPYSPSASRTKRECGQNG